MNMIGGIRRLAIVGLAAAAALAVAPGAARADAAPATAVHYYVSLGDSLAAGEQLATNENFGDRGYADQLYAIEQARIPNLKLVKLGCGGETTSSMIVAVPVVPQGLYEGRGERFHCFPHGSQLADAVSFLHAHRGFVSFVTIDIGGNDVLSPRGGGTGAIQANLPVILGALREAAGPNVPIVGMNYYSPRLAEWFGAPASLPARVAEAVAFNDLLEGIYAAAGDPVADVESAFSTTDTAPVGGVPLDVLRICRWTWTCVAGNIHPNDDGYAVIAHAFEDVLL
jgi:lysophospholipase L1-like esterase